MKLSILLSWCMCMIVTHSVSAQMVNIRSNFNDDLDGWSFEGSGNLYYMSQDGYVQYEDISGPGGDGWIIAPGKFHGNWSVMEDSGQLSWEHIILRAGGVNRILQGQAVIEGPGGSARFTASDYMTEDWKTFSVPVTENAWYITSGTWEDLIGNVTQLKIRIEAVWNETSPLDIDAIDNVSLTSIPEPTTVSLLVIGGLALLRKRY